jgi:hypothetical protein
MITESVRDAIRKKYDIPEGVRFVVEEEVEDDGYGCCHNSYQYIQTTIFWEAVPKGKKRKQKNYRTYTGTVWELVQELELE